jgi:hypothetical protein
MTRRTILAVLVWSIVLPSVFAAQSPSYTTDAEPAVYGQHAAGTSPTYQLSGGITWRDAGPLASTSYQIVTDPVLQTSSQAQSVASSSAPATTATQTAGGHRSSASVGVVHPAAPGSSSSPSVISHSRASTSSLASSFNTVSMGSLGSASSISSIIIEESGSTIPSSSDHCPASCSGSVAQSACQILLTTISSGSTLIAWSDIWMLVVLGFVLGLLVGLLLSLMVRLCLQPATRTRRKKVSKNGRRVVRITLLAACLLALASFAITYTAHAAITTPQRYVYNGHLLDSTGHPITTAHSIRFSFWKSADEVTTDIDNAGELNTGATTYAGWQEVDTVTPDVNGYFSVQLGAGTPLPDLTGYTAAALQSLFLQVEVKVQAAADTSYEVLDVDPTDAAVDRSPIVSVPFAQNADKIDQREIGTGSGSIPLLGPGGKLPASAIPSSLEGTKLIIDSTNSATGSVTLQFGSTLAKTLSYDTVNNLFKFNDSVQIQGNLTVLGLINGVDISALGSVTDALKVGSGSGLNIKIAGGNYRLSGTETTYAGGTSAVQDNTTNYVFFGSGGLTVRTMPFPTDESYIALAEVVTSGGAISYILDRRAPLSDDREEAIETTLHPQYPDSSYAPDGTDNVGQLSIINDTATLKNAYLWTSTRSTQQDYDVVLRVTLPTQFTHWKGSPISFMYKSSSADTTVSKMDVEVFDTAGAAVTLTGTSTNLANTTWTTQTLDFAGTPTWTPGGTVVIRFKMYAKDTEQMMLGDLGLKYVKLSGN